MKVVNIQHNMAMEFMTTLLKCATSDKFSNYIEENRFVTNNEIDKIFQEIHDTMSVFTKNDMSILIKDFRTNFYYPVMLIAHMGFVDVEEFLTYFTSLSSSDYLKTCYELSAADVQLDSEDEELLEKFTDIYGSTEATMFLELKNRPEILKSRLDNLFMTFYEEHFKQYMSIINEEISEKLNDHQKRFEENHEKFLKVIGNGDYSEALNDEYDFKIYVCYLEEFIPRYLTYKTTHLFIYGYSEEQKFKRDTENKHSMEVLKILADDTRLEILRLLSQKNWHRNQLVKKIGLTSATMTYQLNKLIQLGLVEVVTSESGKKSQYRTNKIQFESVVKALMKDILG